MPELTFSAIGTSWTVTTEAPVADALRVALMRLVETYDRTWSRFRPDSLVAQLARKPGSITLPASAAPLLRLYDTLYRVTGGAVNPLVGSSLESLGYDAGYSFRSRDQVPAPAWPETVSWSEVPGGTLLRTTAAATIDIGAAGKGQLVDLVFELLQAAGHGSLTVDAGSDLRHAGPEGLRVGLEHPYDSTRAIGITTLRQGALCASAANRRQWGDGLHHILDAVTGAPTDSVAATWALARDAMTADGLATALFFTDPTALATEFTFDFVRMFSDGRATYSDAMAGVLFS